MMKAVVYFASAFLILGMLGAMAAGDRPADAGESAKSIDARGPLEKITFIHYKKDKNDARPSGKVKPARDTVCYEFLSRGFKWKDSAPEGYNINPLNSGVDDDVTVLSAFEAGANEWDSRTDFDIFGSGSIDYGAIVNLNYADEENTVVFGDYPQEGVIAVTYVWGYFTGPPGLREIVEWDMIFDTDYAWADCTADGVDCTPVDCNMHPGMCMMDLQNIATHELGHAAGLGDLYTSECSIQTMYGYSDYGETSKTDLESGDIAGIQALYGI